MSKKFYIPLSRGHNTFNGRGLSTFSILISRRQRRKRIRASRKLGLKLSKA